MYGIFACIDHTDQPNVGKYNISNIDFLWVCNSWDICDINWLAVFLFVPQRDDEICQAPHPDEGVTSEVCGGDGW